MAGSILYSPAPYHILSYGTFLGTTFFHSFINGIVAFRVLPRPQFSALQAKLFPIYFSLQTVLAVILALTYPGSGNSLSSVAGVVAPANRWSVLLPLVCMFLFGLSNLAVIGPATTKCMRERKAQESKDGKKSYDPPPHSQEMQALNKRFGKLHGISSLLNLGAFVSSVFYGFTISSRIY
ncbi:hypothetical protein VTK73DRAFT_951 [Phialemonium thermophilum]|uniref:TMEM205-like domain-containing protein n=1 Tax=Phialemonium thermophilum TaxID=223376 RepID=A0ABR3XBX0_9PEZI